ncbi:MAG TPA: hypothetical protein VFU67_00785 [Nitrososphaeraceae archaeon]|nr:hypothetical protein [Nitrososphaeraceae archaeon]
MGQEYVATHQSVLDPISEFMLGSHRVRRMAIYNLYIEIRVLMVMNKEFIMIGAMILMSVLVISTTNVGAQNATTNASNAAGNLSASANQTASEAGKNASAALNKTGEALGEFGNKTGEAAQKIGAGAASVFSNLTGEIKEGISNNSNSSK